MYRLGEGSGSLEGVVGDVSLVLRDFFPKHKILKNLNSVSLCAGSSIVTVIFWGDQPNGVSLEIPCYVPFLRTGWNLSRSHPNSKIPVDDGQFSFATDFVRKMRRRCIEFTTWNSRISTVHSVKKRRPTW